MRQTALILLLVAGFTTNAFAGKVYGGITEGGKPIARGTKIDVTCGTNTHSAETDQYGAFNLFVPQQGKCTLKVNHQGQAPTFEIQSYDGSVQYDLILERQDGKYTLKRK